MRKAPTSAMGVIESIGRPYSWIGLIRRREKHEYDMGSAGTFVRMLRERDKWRTHEADNIDVASRGGATRSSVEMTVMVVERSARKRKLEGVAEILAL